MIRGSSILFRRALPLVLLFSQSSFAQGRLPQAGPRHIGGYRWAAYTPDGSSIVYTRDSGGVWYFDPTTRTTTRIPDTVAASISAGCFSKDGKLLALAGEAGTGQVAEIRRVSDGALVGAFDSHADRIHAVALSSDHKLLAVAGSLLQTTDGVDSSILEVWNVASGRRLYTRVTPRATLNAIAFSPDGKSIAGTGRLYSQEGTANTVTVWTAKTGTVRISRVLANQISFAVSYFPDGKTLAVGGQAGEGALDLLNARTLANTAFFAPRFAATSLSVAPEGRFVVLGGKALEGPESALRVDTAAGNVLTLQTDALPTASVVFSPDGSHVLIAGAGAGPRARRCGVLEVCNAATGEVAADISRNEYIGPAALSSDGTHFVISGRSSAHTPTVEMQDLLSGKSLASLPTTASDIGALDFSPDGRMVAIGGSYMGPSGTLQASLQIWTTANRSLRFTLSTALTDVSCCKFSPDGSLLAATGSGHADGETGPRVELWSTTSGELVRVLNSRAQELTCLAFSPDGSHLVDAGTWARKSRYFPTGIAELWNVADGSFIRAFDTSACRVIESVAFAPDGDTVATGGVRGVWLQSNGLVEIWNANTGRRMESIGVGPDAASCLGYSPLGSTLFIDAGQSLQIYLTEGYRLSRRFDMIPGTEASVALGPGGTPVLFRRQNGAGLTWAAPFAAPFTLKLGAVTSSGEVSATLLLPKPAPAEGVTFVLSSNALWLAEPAVNIVTIPAGETRETIPIRVHASSRPGKATITAQEGLVAHSAELMVGGRDKSSHPSP